LHAPGDMGMKPLKMIVDEELFARAKLWYKICKLMMSYCFHKPIYIFLFYLDIWFIYNRTHRNLFRVWRSRWRSPSIYPTESSSNQEYWLKHHQNKSHMALHVGDLTMYTQRLYWNCLPVLQYKSL